MDRKNKRDIVASHKIEIKDILDRNFEEQIKKTYKDDTNYLLRDINYTQVESSSPSFSMKGRNEIGSAFYNDKQNQSKEYSSPNKQKNIDLENPDFSLIRPRYPAFSFGTSKRFNSLDVDAKRTKSNIFWKKNQPKIIFADNDNNGNSNINNNNNITNYKRYENDNWYNSLYFYGSQDSQSFLKTQTMMGTGKKMPYKDNGFPAPNQYKIRGFAEDVKMKGDKVNATRVMLKEKKKLEDLERINMAKLREKRFEEKKRALRMNLKDNINSNFNNKEEALSKEAEYDEKYENKDIN